MRIDYLTIAALSAEIGCNVTDLIALSSQNDPFYTGMPSRRQAGEWFADLWERFGWLSGMHLRRAHYIIISQDPPVLKPNGDPYINTLNDWKFLGTASLAARYDHLIPDNALVDRRNPQPVIHVAEPFNYPPQVYVSFAEASPRIAMPDLDLPGYGVYGMSGQDAYLVEVWVEKSTQNDILVPLGKRLGFNVVPGIGETSETLARQAVERAIRDGRPMRILYVSDFDPAGRSMPVGLARKIEFLVRDADLDVDITLDPILLLPHQCAHYRLPRTPLKESERRAAKFEQRFGEGATELDALEALYPGHLAKIVEREARRYIDLTLPARAREVEWRQWSAVTKAAQVVRDQHNVDDLMQRYGELQQEVSDFMAQIDEAWAEIAADLKDKTPKIDPAIVPKPVEATPPEAPLFDSRRDYLEQIDAYRAWQGKGEAA